MIRVLVVDDDHGLRLSLKANLASYGQFLVEDAANGLLAIEKFESQNFDVVLLDVDMPLMGGMQTLQKIKEKCPSAIVIMLTAYATIDLAVQAIKEGAFDFLQKPVQFDQIQETLKRAFAAQALINDVVASSPVLVEEGRPFVGANQQMQKVFGLIHKLSKVDTPVLIRGASGTGKELVARAIHYNSARKNAKFVAINCSAIPENLFESELFGHEKGAFTGADQRKIGKFQFAEGGTLFLDEVGDLPLLMQVKLLRVLQEKVFTPVGSNREIQSQVRIVAATNRPLEEMMKKGTFREDLFYRLNVIPIFLPSLADRKDDIERLVANFVRKFNEQQGKKIRGLSPEALSVFRKYDWPGNIRELENVIEHAFIMETGNLISLGALPQSLLNKTGTVLPEYSDPYDHPVLGKIGMEHDLVGENSNQPLSSQSDPDPLKSSRGVYGFSARSDFADDNEIKGFQEVSDEVNDEAADEGEEGVEFLGQGNASMGLDFNAQKEAFEKEFIIKALKTFKGRINQTALHANIPKKTLLRKIEKYGINAKDFS